MTHITRRSLVAWAGMSALAGSPLFAQDHGHHGESADCDMATPSATPSGTTVGSDIPFDLAYIDTMIPHHASVIALAERAQDELQDDRLVAIAHAIIETQPGEIATLMEFRTLWYPDESEDVSDERLHEMMIVTMVDRMDACDGPDHMDLMDSEWLVAEFDAAEDKDIRFIDLVIPHHQMAVDQSENGLVLADHEELVTLCEEVIEAQTAEIEMLRRIRGEIISGTA